MRLKRLQREADHSYPSSAKIKNEWSYTSTPAISLHGVDSNTMIFIFTDINEYVTAVLVRDDYLQSDYYQLDFRINVLPVSN